MRVIPYINLSGAAEEALSLYREVFGGKAEVMRWEEMPPDPKMPVSDAWRSKIMHGSLAISEGATIYLADSLPGGEEAVGNNVFLHVEFDSEDDLRRAFKALSVGGAVNMPVDRMFWGAIYGGLVDRFGIGWGFHYQPPE